MNTGSTIRRQWKSTRKVWDNNSYKSFGIEFLVRLILVTLPFLDLGLYLRNMSQGKNKLLARKIVTDIYVVMNMMLPAIVLYYGWYEYKFVAWICVYFGVMTLIALLARTMLDDLIPAAISYKRNIICLFLNYLQFVLLFAVLYLGFAPDGFSIGGEKFSLTGLKAIYLSFEVFTSVGFGDIVPQTKMSYCILIFQMIIQLIFVYVLFATFVTKISDDTFYNKKKMNKPQDPVTKR